MDNETPSNPTPETVGKDLSCEEWRQYDFIGRVFRIENPKLLFCRPGGSTHRVVATDGTVYCLPAPGFNGCVLSWKSRDPNKPVSF